MLYRPADKSALPGLPLLSVLLPVVCCQLLSGGLVTVKYFAGSMRTGPDKYGYLAAVLAFAAEFSAARSA